MLCKSGDSQFLKRTSAPNPWYQNPCDASIFLHARTTPVFMDSKLLESLTYEDFVTFIRSNVRYLSQIGKFRMTIIDGDDLDSKVWQIRDVMKRLNKLVLNVFESSSIPTANTETFSKKSSQDKYSPVASSNTDFQKPKARSSPLVQQQVVLRIQPLRIQQQL